MADKVFLIDGMAMAFRAYFAIRSLTNSRGQATNAVFGFTRKLLQMLRDEKPSHMVMVFDAPGKTFRDDIYPEYKSHRPPTPDDLISQFALIDEVVEAFQIPVVRIPGVEADDVLATLAKRAAGEGKQAVIVTGDKDLLQCVGDGVDVFDPFKNDVGKWYDAAAVQERYGVPPENVIDVLALMGDSADNIPGVRGIGEKTARKLLEKYGDLDGIYANLDELKGKQKEKVTEDREIAYLSKELVTIKTDVETDLDWADCTVDEPDAAALAELFKRFEFRGLTEEFLPAGDTDEDLKYELVLTEDRLKEVAAEMRAAGVFAVDTETTSIDAMQARLVGISMSCAEQTGYYVPVGHSAASVVVEGESGDLFEAPKAPGLDPAVALKILAPLFADEKIGKIGHNIKYDMLILENAGAPVRGVVMDTMVASYLTDPGRLRHNLDDVSLHYLTRKLIPISELIGKGAKAITFDNVPVEKACDYACEDADITWRLAEVFTPLLEERALTELFQSVELPLISVLARMELAGVAIDEPLFDTLREEIGTRLAELVIEIHELAGEPFSINSPKQLQEILFGRLGLKPVKKTKTGYSTDVEVLEILAADHPLPEKILEYRTLDKLRGTYVDALPTLVNPATQRLHTSFNQAVAATGRLSSSDPNLQNIPIRTDMGRRIREGFVPGKKGDVLISADYSQIELRILAHLADDPHLKQAFHDDEDIHRDTAARVFGLDPDDVTPDMRRQAKAVNFGVVYGISAFGLAKNLGTSRGEAQVFIDRYFEKYPGVKIWMDQTIENAREMGYVKTMLNRRRYLLEIKGSDVQMRKTAERMAINTPVQGSAADIIKLAMVELDPKLRDEGAQMVMQVHDELVVEAPKKKAKAIAALMREVMENVVPMEVPLKVDVGIGPNWAAIH